MHFLAANSSGNSPGVWAYLAIFAATAAGYMGVPFVGTAALGAAAVFASQGVLNFAAVLIVAVIGHEIGGLLGYGIGDRWGRQVLEHPGPALGWRKKALAKGEAIYQKWGRLAVFFTPALVSGALKMTYRQFVVWNFFAGTVFVLSVGPAAYGTGRVASSHHDLASVSLLVGGIAVGSLGVLLEVRHHRRHRVSTPATVAQGAPVPPLGVRRAAPGDHHSPRPPGPGPAH